MKGISADGAKPRIIAFFVVTILISRIATAQIDDPSSGASTGHFGPPEPVLSLEETLALAEQGDATAQFSLGVHYANGYGVAKDDKEAVKWFRKAADQGNAKAQTGLGTCYWVGDGVAKDDKEAVTWYRRAAEQGDARAQFNLGTCYAVGDGVTMDFVEAYKWLNLAAVELSEGAGQRNELASLMTPEQIAEAQRRSSAFRPVIG